MKFYVMSSVVGAVLALATIALPARADTIEDFTYDKWCTEIAQKDAATCARHGEADVSEYLRVRSAMSRMEQDYLDDQCKQSSQPNAMRDCRKKNYEIDPNPPATADPFGLRPR
jgi:hypothetical protein